MASAKGLILLLTLATLLTAIRSSPADVHSPRSAVEVMSIRAMPGDAQDYVPHAHGKLCADGSAPVGTYCSRYDSRSRGVLSASFYILCHPGFGVEIGRGRRGVKVTFACPENHYCRHHVRADTFDLFSRRPELDPMPAAAQIDCIYREPAPPKSRQRKRRRGRDGDPEQAPQQRPRVVGAAEDQERADELAAAQALMELESVGPPGSERQRLDWGGDLTLGLRLKPGATPPQPLN